MDAASEHYLVERVMTASPAELTAMLYDAAVGAVRAAIRLRQSGQTNVSDKLLKAQRIVLELRLTLNPEAGEMAANLEKLYMFAHEKLVAANSATDTRAMQDALVVLEPLATAWREACCASKPTRAAGVAAAYASSSMAV